MAKKRPAAAPAPPAPPVRASITAERFVRLNKLLKLLASGPQTRATLTKKLNLDVRGFYRDLELLRDAQIPIQVEEGSYSLQEDLAVATARLPYPDPVLTLGEMQQLAKGKSAAHTKLRQQINDLLK
jgi:predicted DNA-binding transcriptional regulator YafY